MRSGVIRLQSQRFPILGDSPVQFTIKLLEEVMGKEEPVPKVAGVFVRVGPFGKRPEFRREYFHLLEARATEATEAAKATPLWVRAIREWYLFNEEYHRGRDGRGMPVLGSRLMPFHSSDTKRNGMSF